MAVKWPFSILAVFFRRFSAWRCKHKLLTHQRCTRLSNPRPVRDNSEKQQSRQRGQQSSTSCGRVAVNYSIFLLSFFLFFYKWSHSVSQITLTSTLVKKLTDMCLRFCLVIYKRGVIQVHIKKKIEAWTWVLEKGARVSSWGGGPLGDPRG